MINCFFWELSGKWREGRHAQQWETCRWKPWWGGSHAQQWETCHWKPWWGGSHAPQWETCRWKPWWGGSHAPQWRHVAESLDEEEVMPHNEGHVTESLDEEEDMPQMKDMSLKAEEEVMHVTESLDEEEVVKDLKDMSSRLLTSCPMLPTPWGSFTYSWLSWPQNVTLQSRAVWSAPTTSRSWRTNWRSFSTRLEELSKLFFHHLVMLIYNGNNTGLWSSF